MNITEILVNSTQQEKLWLLETFSNELENAQVYREETLDGISTPSKKEIWLQDIVDSVSASIAEIAK